MSDDLVSKMRQAADAVISTTPSDDQPLQLNAQSAEDDAQEPLGEAGEPAEEPTEEPAEAEASGAGEEAVDGKPEKKLADDEDNDFFIIKKQAERKVAKAEARVKDLEAKLAASVDESDRSKKQVADDIFKKLRRKPIATFKEFGLEFQDLIDAGIRETQGTDDRVVSEIDELRAELREMKEERKARKEQEEEVATQRKYEAARNQFLDMVTKKEFPTLYNMFEDDPDALWTEAQRVAERLASKDDDIDDLEIIKMLEDKYRARLKKLGGGSVAEPPKKAAPKTLTTKAASEVRTTGKPFGQLSSDEQKEALKAAVKKALNQSPN